MKKLEVLNSTESNKMDYLEGNQPSENDKMINEIINSAEVSNNDIMKGIAMLLEGQKSMQANIEKIDKALKEVTDDVKLNTKNIEIVNENCAKNNDLILQNVIAINHLKQEKIDNEIFLSGLSELPDDKYAIKELLRFYDTPRNHVISYRAAPVNKPNGKKATFMFIMFATKEDQIQFLDKVRKKGTINRATLLENKTAADEAKSLKVSRSLTPENRKIITRLSAALNDKKIKKVRYRNCCYQFQPLTNEAFITVPTSEHLKLYGF